MSDIRMKSSIQHTPLSGAPAGEPSEPSMEEILASIRRILSEDDANDGDTASTAGAAVPAPMKATPTNLKPDHDVLELDEGMMIDDQMHTSNHEPLDLGEPVSSGHGLVAPEAAAGVSASVGTLLRKINAERQTQVHRGGPTIEDMIRDEMRPMVKQWLDSHLPSMVERIVTAEIERVIARGIG